MTAVRARHGFTLIEMMIALVVVGILGIAMANIFRTQHQAHGRQNQGVERTMNARAAMDMMAREVRNAGYDPRGNSDAGFIRTDTSDIEWTTDLNGDGDTDDSTVDGDEHVRYYHESSDGTIVRVANGVETVIADFVTDLEFTYLDEDLEVTFDGEKIEQVNITMSYATPGGTPSGALETQAAVRNRIYMATVCATSPTMIAGGDIEISSKLNLLGCSKSLHVNGDLKVGGDPVVEGSVSVTGSVQNADKLRDTEGNAVEVETGAGEMDIEKITNPTSSHCDDADYHLKSNGKIEDLATGTEYDATSSEYRGWKRSGTSPVIWDYSSDAEYPGTYCVEGSVKISGDPGKDEGSAVEMSIIAKGSIEISGKPYMSAADAGGYLLLAGGDLKISGDAMGPLTNFTGDLYAYSQCEISGKPKFNGQLICAENPTPGHAEDHTDAGKSKVSGDMTLTYACTGDCDE